MKSLLTKETVKNLALITIGSFLYAVSVNVFTVPNDLAEGGLTGFSLILFYLSGIEPSYTIFISNTATNLLFNPLSDFFIFF